jgi:hypothetical protein
VPADPRIVTVNMLIERPERFRMHGRAVRGKSSNEARDYARYHEGGRGDD